MNKLGRILLAGSCFMCFTLGGLTQEILVPPGANPHLKRLAYPAKAGAKAAGAEALALPFFDDFSDSKVLPDPRRWADFQAYVNHSFPVEPVSLGVVTLDALDARGGIYPSSGFGSASMPADTLTSLPLDLALEAADSLYLSFFYQPGGLGDVPEETDSLLLDFFRASDTSWVNIWGIPGSGLHEFRQVMLPITDTSFLNSDFQFRFRNLVSLSENPDYPDKIANVDLWNLDYIRLESGRSMADTVLRDVAFVKPVSSILKDLSAVPWDHFEDAYQLVLDPTVPARYLNNDTIARNLTRQLLIEEPLWGDSYTPAPATAQDLGAGEDTVVEFTYIYPQIDFQRGDSAIFRFKASLRTDQFDPKVNDTVYHDQLFSDYYAYDDGSHEAGYGLRGGGSANGSVALKYLAFKPDLIGGVEVSFNQLKDSVNLGYYFSLLVWGDKGGVPGQMLLEDEEDRQPFYPSSYPGFVRYYFSEPVEVDGVFYVGWRQFNEYNINFGLDLNSLTETQVIYYNLGSDWIPSEAPGALMIRPFIYDPTVGIQDRSGQAQSLQPYPNPASSQLNLNLPDSFGGGDFQLRIYDLSGRMVRQERCYDQQITVDDLAEGLYHLQVRSATMSWQGRFLILR